jgi:hypothetical protein
MRHTLTVTALLAAGALLAAAAATAATLSVSGTLTGAGALSFNLPSAPSFSATLAGDDQTTSYAPVLGVVDARGSGAGWNVSISSTALTDGSGHNLTQTVSAVSSACHAGSTCTGATNSVTYPITLSTTSAKVFDAAVGTGMGKVDVTPTIQIPVPGNAYAGSYSATLTLTAATGP